MYHVQNSYRQHFCIHDDVDVDDDDVDDDDNDECTEGQATNDKKKWIKMLVFFKL